MDPGAGQQYGGDENPMAYGDYHRPPSANPENSEDFSEATEGERGIIGDTYRKFRGKYQSQYDGSSQSKPKPPSGGLGSFFLNKVKGAVEGIGSKLESNIGPVGSNTHSHTHVGLQCDDGSHINTQHRYGSFAAQRTQNDAKWYVDGCGYMWAVSEALERATESIWILDWWLSPELYLRRPPSKNEQYRLDRMLQAAAQRGVKVNVIVYKEVTQALTLCSYHTKHALENLHPNISVFRHPDHLPDAQTLQSSFFSSLQNLSLSAKTAATLPEDALKAIYGMNDDVVLYWAHHEKLCLVDGRIAFMGGLDLCFGRWDTNQHPLADCHPANLDDIVFPGQDYNNARIMDFQDVTNWENNKVNRKDSARMGWSDLSISLSGPVVEDLRGHFVERWNFIYNEKYDVRKDTRYSRLTFTQNMAGTVPYHSTAPPSASQPSQSYQPPGSQTANQAQGSGVYPPPPSRPQDHSQGQAPYFPPPPVSGRGLDEESVDQQGARGIRAHIGHQGRETLEEEARGLGQAMYGRFEDGKQYFSGNEHYGKVQGKFQEAGISCQIVRSCTKWSHGVPTEHSIANAYISVIENSQHFIYIENQFFVTATSDAQKPVKNKIGAAIVERILRAARASQKFKVIVIIPAIPGFAGDLRDDGSLGTRAIMEYQYNSINRGGHSIMELVAKEGFDPTEYIRFYNLRNYDRINVSGSMREAEQKSGVDYNVAREQHDLAVELPADEAGGQHQSRPQYEQYQQTTTRMDRKQGLYTGRWDSVSECYMLGGKDIREVPWEAGDYPEIKAFVSEELYLHTKICIADDRVVIVGSANMNDRSQLGDHDSEIAVIIEDPNPVDSFMNGEPYRAARFAATLRRQLFRKHLGLLKPQDMERPDQNFHPVGVPNVYDYGSPEDQAVMDPVADNFLNFWNTRAHTNTYAFGKIFHPVPHDDVKTWDDYQKYYEVYFHEADEEADGKEGKKKPSKYMWGHVVEEEFSPGEQGLKEVKELLSTIKGTLVEMPLLFLIKEDIAKEGLSFNAFTEEVYT